MSAYTLLLANPPQARFRTVVIKQAVYAIGAAAMSAAGGVSVLPAVLTDLAAAVIGVALDCRRRAAFLARHGGGAAASGQVPPGSQGGGPKSPKEGGRGY